jgi:hypothetical protein
MTTPRMIEWPLVGRGEALAACDALARGGGFGWISAVAGPPTPVTAR